MIDCHCHLAYKGLIEIIDKVMAESKHMYIIACGYPNDYKKTMEICKKYNNVFLALGLHPIDIEKMTDVEVKEYTDIIRKNADDIVAVGEIGLDFHWYSDPKQNERFKKVFIECLELANEIDKPVVLHTRKAEQECFDIVKEMRMKRVDFHCYAGSITLAKKIIESGYYISLATNLENSKNSRKIAKNFPIDKLLTETDSPFLSHIPNQVNRPINVKTIIEKIAEFRGMTFEDVDRITTENARKFFNLNI